VDLDSDFALIFLFICYLFTFGIILFPLENMSCCFQSMIEEPEKVDWVQGEIPPIGKE
jgi:hypothetical protein